MTSFLGSQNKILEKVKVDENNVFRDKKNFFQTRAHAGFFCRTPAKVKMFTFTVVSCHGLLRIDERSKNMLYPQLIHCIT